MATIREVAKLAGVSTATVSRVFNGHNVSARRSQAVRAAAEALAFTPNPVARTLRTKRSSLIALVVPEIRNPFFSDIARGVEDAGSARGYSLVICNTDADAAKERKYLRVIGTGNMAGAIVAPVSARTRVGDLQAHGCAVVAVDRGLYDCIDCVKVDNEEAGRLAVRDLLRRGYKTIGCITGPRGMETATARMWGWRSEFLRSGSTGRSQDLVKHSEYDAAGGRASMSALLDGPVEIDAVVAANNILGVGALQELVHRSIPLDRFGLAVVGSIPFALPPVHPMTSVRLPAYDMGVRAAAMLFERIDGEAGAAREVLLACAMDRVDDEAHKGDAFGSEVGGWHD